MDVYETPITFSCHDDALFGILHAPEHPGRRGVVIIAGAPQTRVGSHRQFVHLARGFAPAGYPVLRFDYRGMGESEGEFRGFDEVYDDIRAAVDQLFARVSDLKDVVLLGLCDGASAAAFYAPTDERVAGLVLINPWVRTEQSQSSAYVSHYYGQRLRDPQFWRKALSGGVSVKRSVRELVKHVGAAMDLKRSGQAAKPTDAPVLSLADRVFDALDRYRGNVLLVLSGNDLTAQEFSQVAGLPRWRGVAEKPSVERFDLADANHTFSRKEWREQVAGKTRAWLESW